MEQFSLTICVSQRPNIFLLFTPMRLPVGLLKFMDASVKLAPGLPHFLGEHIPAEQPRRIGDSLGARRRCSRGAGRGAVRPGVGCSVTGRHPEQRGPGIA